MPYGYSVNRAKLDHNTGLFVVWNSKPYQIIMLGLNEAVGLEVDTGNDHLYVSDLGGSVYKCNRDGTQKKKIYSLDGLPLTGLTLL